MKDRRYKTVRNLINGGFITSFNEIFETLPKTRMAQDMGINNIRFSRLITHVDQFTLKELFIIARLLEIEDMRLVNLVYAQYAIKNRLDYSH